MLARSDGQHLSLWAGDLLIGESISNMLGGSASERYCLSTIPLFVRLGRFAGAEPRAALRPGRAQAHARRQPGCPGSSRTRTGCAPTGPRGCSRTASRFTASPAVSATPICAPPAATPSTTPTRSTTSPMSLIAATKHRGELAADAAPEGVPLSAPSLRHPIGRVLRHTRHHAGADDVGRARRPGGRSCSATPGRPGRWGA